MATLRTLLCALLVLASTGSATAAPKRTTFVLPHVALAPPKGVKPVPPTVLVHFASGWKKSGPLNLVVHFHGINNCVAATVEKGPSAPCTGAGAGTPHDLIGQLDRSGANVILIALETAYRAANTDPGNLAKPGFFKAMVDDTLTQIDALQGTHYAGGRIDKLVLTSHSGGYAALIESATEGGLRVDAIFLMDSYYPAKTKCADLDKARKTNKNIAPCSAQDRLKNDQAAAKYLDWLAQDPSHRRFINIYSAGGATLKGSQLLAKDAQARGVAVETLGNKPQRDKSVSDALLDQRALFLYSGYVHDQIPREWFGRVVPHLLR